MLNPDTLLLVQISFTLLTTALLISAAFYTDSLQEQRLWAGGNVALCIGFALGTQTQMSPLIHAVLGYGIMAFGMGLVLRGLRLFYMQSLDWRTVALITVLAMLLPAYYTVVEPSLRGRLCATGFYFAALNWICAYTVARHGNWRAMAACVTGFAMLGVVLLLRGIYLFDPVQGENANGVLMNVTLFLIPLAQVCIAFGLILMVTRRYAERLHRLSALDHLTGALNRLGLEGQGQRVMQRAQRSGRSVTVMMIDVDFFKQINDNCGHPVGDEVLRQLARLLRAELRPLDLMARFGGEEFVLVLDSLNLPEALGVAERLRTTVEQQKLEIDGHAIRYTVSIGVVSTGEAGYDLARMIAVGDRAMYEAKRAGRNRVLAAGVPAAL